MTCEDVMKTDVQCASPDDTVKDVARKMRDANIGFVPTCDQEKKVLGTITDRDIVIRVVADGRPLDTKVSECMTREVIACHPEDDLRDAERLMAEKHKSRILVLDDDGELLGVISLSDIAEKDRRNAASTMAKVSEREAHIH